MPADSVEETIADVRAKAVFESDSAELASAVTADQVSHLQVVYGGSPVACRTESTESIEATTGKQATVKLATFKPTTIRLTAKDDTTNHVNTILILLSLCAAWFLPFQLFVFSYAVLGPLHYLTEISWLHDRQYFTNNKKSNKALWLLAVIPAILAFKFGQDARASLQLGSQVVYAALVIAVFACTFEKKKIGSLTMVLVILACLPIMFFSPLTLFVATIIPTLIHIFIFTWMFMLAGATKSRSLSAFISLGAFSACAVIALSPIPSNTLPASPAVMHAIRDFGRLDLTTANLLGWKHPEQLIAVMRFIAFGYTYHYLNWFSKSKVIQWHKVPRQRAVTIGVIYVGALGLYALNYGLGVQALYFLSVAHVFLEFPLDFKTGRALIMQSATWINNGINSGPPSTRLPLSSTGMS